MKTIILALSVLSFGVSVLAQEKNFAAEKAANGWTFDVDSAYGKESGERAKGLVVPENWRTMAPFKSQKQFTSEKLPAKWDWRERGGVTPIKNQGSCGSCWAFGTAAALESAVMIATGKLTSISEQQLVSCSSYGSCGGGYYAFGFYEQKGAAYTSDFPYAARNSACKSNLPQNEKIVDWSYVGSSNGSPTTEEIKSAIFNYGTVAVTVSASGAFDSYRSGVYNACNSGQTNHMVALVGWDDETQTWIMKNSWGKNWGEDGYMRIKYTDSQGRKCNRVGESAAYAVFKPGR